MSAEMKVYRQRLCIKVKRDQRWLEMVNHDLPWCQYPDEYDFIKHISQGEPIGDAPDLAMDYDRMRIAEWLLMSGAKSLMRYGEYR